MPGATLRSALLALFAAGALAACDDRGGGNRTSDGEDVPDSLRFGGTVTVASYGDLQSMNALTSSDNTSNSIQREVLFMPLLKYNEKIEPVPWLAERWDTTAVAPDSLDLTFHIRRDVRWHDGRPTTARDVLFSFKRAIDPQTAFPNASGFAEYNPNAVLVDDYTIRFRLRRHSDFWDAWYQMPPMPEHVLGQVPPAQLLQHPFQHQPVGNGPFRFVRRLANQEWVFDANPDFPAALGGRPYIDRLVYRAITEQTTLLTELLTGNVDVYLQPNPSQAAQITASPSLRLEATPNRQWNYIAWNTRLPQFRDARVRRALTMAIDRQRIVDALLFGYADVGRNPVTPAHWSYDPNDARGTVPYDTAAAKRLLREAGWEDRNRDGVLENAEGVPFRFELKTNAGNDLRKDIAEVVQAQLRPLGIVVQPRLVEWNTHISQLSGTLRGGERVRDFDAVISSWVDYFRKDDRDILHSSRLNEPYQYVGYSNPRVDQLIDSVAVMTDRAAARPLWMEYQHIMAQEQPYTVLYYPKRLTGINKRLNGVQMDIRGEFNTVNKWWIHPDQRRAASRPAAPAAPRPDSPADSAKK